MLTLQHFVIMEMEYAKELLEITMETFNLSEKSNGNDSHAKDGKKGYQAASLGLIELDE